MLAQNFTLYILLQNVSEFWNVCTRPLDKNGFGFSIAQADAELSKIESVFDLLSDTEEVYRNWRELIVSHSVSGVKVHDAKIVAAMKAHNIQSLLTFNAKDFKHRHQSRRAERCLKFWVTYDEQFGFCENGLITLV